MTLADPVIQLAAGAWRMGVRPALGGAITCLTLDDVPVLRSTPAETRSLLDCASFPLVPYANRIEHGRLTVGPDTYPIPPNLAGHPYPLHGLGWLRPWRIADRSDARLLLEQEHAGDEAWPFAYLTRQEIALDEGGATFRLALTNRHRAAVPMSLGFHPYFAGGEGGTIGFDAARVWLSDEYLIPTAPAPADHFGAFDDGRAVVRDDLLDNSFEGWTGPAVIEGPYGTIHLTGEGTNVLHLYMPPGADFFCAEPVTALPNGVNRNPELLAPGATREIVMRIGHPA